LPDLEDSMVSLSRVACALLLVPLPSFVAAEIPLPDATYFGHITTPEGAPVGTGTLTARVVRGANLVITVPGVFVASEGQIWAVVRVPLETSIGAPGPSGQAAREGDQLESYLLNGKKLEFKSTPAVIQAGLASQLDAIATDVPPIGLVFFRGDCSPDLKLSITDAVRVLNYLFISPAEPPCLAACDSDASGSLNITDGVYLLSFLFLGGPPPPAPGPQCGTDPNTSQLGCAQTNCEL